MTTRVTLQDLKDLHASEKKVQVGALLYSVTKTPASINKELHDYLGTAGLIKVLICNPDTVAAQPTEERGAFVLAGVDMLPDDMMMAVGYQPRMLHLLDEEDRKTFAQKIYQRLTKIAAHADIEKFTSQDWVQAHVPHKASTAAIQLPQSVAAPSRPSVASPPRADHPRRPRMPAAHLQRPQVSPSAGRIGSFLGALQQSLRLTP